MHKVGDRVGVGCMVNSCRECENCLAGEEQYCLKGNTGTYAAVDRDGTITQGGYSTHIVVVEDFVLKVPERSRSRRPRRCSAPASPPTRRSRTGTPAPASASPSSAWADSATWPSRSPTPWAPRSPCCRRRLSKQEDGLRLGADHYFATSDPATFSSCATVRPHHQHRERVDRHRRLPLAAAPRRHARERRRPARAAAGAASSRCSATVARSPARASAASARRRRCSTSAPSTASRPRPS